MTDITTYYLTAIGILTAIIMTFVIHNLGIINRERKPENTKSDKMNKEITQNREKEIKDIKLKHDIPPASASSTDDPNDEPSYKKIRKWKRQI